MSRIVWQAQAKQAEFLRRREYECLYGGAAGGGKSDAAVMMPLYWVGIPHFKALILRKTYPQLAELIDKSLDYYRRAFPRARYNATEHRWRFPSGASVIFGSMQHTKDKERYRGAQFDLIIFDELTHFTWDEYSFMFSRNRPGGPGTFVGIRATTNPGGVGHGWVKDRFITAAPPMTPIESRVEVQKPGGGLLELKRKRIFVPATVFDNQRLLENDPAYLANLAMMPEAERNAQLYGSWDSFDGQVFREWLNDPAAYDAGAWTHVTKPFRVPAHWKRYRGFDFGYAKPFAVGWYAVDPDGRIYRIAEYYGCTATPNTGVQMHPVEIAANIKRIEAEDANLRGHTITGIADPSIFDESRGESIAAMMERSPNFVYWGKGDNTRIPGKMQFHYRLAFDGQGMPMMQVFDTCKHFIRTLPALVYDTKHVEDIDTAQEDHIYDECRYVLMERPIGPRKNEAPGKRPENDPLNLWTDKQDAAKIYRI